MAWEKPKPLRRKKNAGITTVLADLDSNSLKENEYDLILCFNFLERSLFSGIHQALKPGGLLFYETFTVDYLKYSNFKKEWVLEENELLQAFSDFRILRYQEVDENPKAFASLVAQKPWSITCFLTGVYEVSPKLSFNSYLGYELRDDFGLHIGPGEIIRN